MLEYENQIQDALQQELQGGTSELQSLKIQSKQKENSWSKERAILEQRIELQDLQIKEYKSREDNLRKMNETFMDTLSGLSNDSSKFSNKSLKDLKGLLEGMNTDNETSKIKRLDLIAKLEQENRELKDLQHERTLEFDQLLRESEKKISEQEAIIAGLSEQTKSLIAAAKKAEEDDRAARNTLVSDYQKQVDDLTKNIEKIRLEYAVEISTQSVINEQRLQQLKLLYEKERTIPQNKELSESEINYIDEIQLLHHTEVTRLHGQLEALQETAQQEEFTAKKAIQELEHQLQKVTEKLKNFKLKNITNEQNIKLMKEKFERQALDHDEFDSLKEYVKKLKQKNSYLQSEIRKQESIEQSLKEQMIQDIGTNEVEQRTLHRKESIYKPQSEFTDLNNNQQTEFMNEREANASTVPNSEITSRGSNTQPDGSVRVTPRQHFKSVSESSEYPPSMGSGSRGEAAAVGHFNSFTLENEDLPKRAQRQTNNKQVPSQQQSNSSSNNRLAGQIVQKGLNKNINSPSQDETTQALKQNSSVANLNQPTVNNVQNGTQFYKSNTQGALNLTTASSKQLQPQKVGLIPPIASVMRSSSTASINNSANLKNSNCPTASSGSLSNRGGRQGSGALNNHSVSNEEMMSKFAQNQLNTQLNFLDDEYNHTQPEQHFSAQNINQNSCNNQNNFENHQAQINPTHLSQVFLRNQSASGLLLLQQQYQQQQQLNCNSNNNQNSNSNSLSQLPSVVSRNFCEGCSQQKQQLSPIVLNAQNQQRIYQQQQLPQTTGSQFIDANNSYFSEPFIFEIQTLRQLSEDLSRQLEQSIFENNNLHAANETLSNELKLSTNENGNLFKKIQELMQDIEHLNNLLTEVDCDRKKKEENEGLLKQEIKYLVEKLLKAQEKQFTEMPINSHTQQQYSQQQLQQTQQQHNPSTPRTEGQLANITRSFSRMSGMNSNTPSSPSIKFDKNKPGRDSTHPSRNDLSQHPEDNFQHQSSFLPKAPQAVSSSVNISQIFNQQNCVNQSLCLNGSTKSPGFLNFIHQNKENSSFQTRKAAFGSVERSGSALSGRIEDNNQSEASEVMMMALKHARLKGQILPNSDQPQTNATYNSVPIDQMYQNTSTNVNQSYDTHFSSTDPYSNMKTAASSKQIPLQSSGLSKQTSTHLKSLIQKDEERSFYLRSKIPFSQRFNSSVDRKSEQSLMQMLALENMAKKQLFSSDQQSDQQKTSQQYQQPIQQMRGDIPKSKQTLLFN